MSNSNNQMQANNSTPVFTREILEKARHNGGSVTYFVKEERYNVRTNKTYTKRTAVLVSKLNHDLLVTPKGRNYPFTDVAHVLATTCESLGADYFVVQ